MRPEARRRLGYYPCPPAAIDVLCSFLEVPHDPSTVHICDPCAGEGHALGQIAAHLQVPPANVWAIELDGARGQRIRETIPEAKLLSPCSYFDAGIRSRAFSLIYCNPPFDDSAVVGRRIEQQFLERVAWHLVPHGVLAFVAPEYVIREAPFINVMREWFYDVFAVRWPAAIAQNNELFVLGKAREHFNADSSVSASGPKQALSLPKAPGAARKWAKEGLTPEELEQALANSPLEARIRPPAASKLASPPLELRTGHLALLLASGVLDGIVSPPGEEPHIVRGTVRKVEVETGMEQTVLDSGAVKTTTKLTEKIELTVRALCSDGQIATFTQ